MPARLNVVSHPRYSLPGSKSVCLRIDWIRFLPMAVTSTKNSAFDFFEKPFNDNSLVDSVAAALARLLRDADARLENQPAG